MKFFKYSDRTEDKKKKKVTMKPHASTHVYTLLILVTGGSNNLSKDNDETYAENFTNKFVFTISFVYIPGITVSV